MKFVWMDGDPGHDDAFAILLGLHCPHIKLLGISTTYGNASGPWTAVNAARCLHLFGAASTYPEIRVYPGAAKPLLRPTKHAPKIHGVDGLGCVQGLPNAQDPNVTRWMAGTAERAINGLSAAVRNTWDNGKGSKVSIISSGPMTNIALFVSVYPDLLEVIEEIVFMGGGIGIGNKSTVAEYNIACDPLAAQILLDAPVKKTMIPLNVTHMAILTPQIHAKLLSPAYDWQGADLPLPTASSNLREMLSALISSFAESYRKAFGFADGPPLHDALTVAYIACPDIFSAKRFRVDVEQSGIHTSGETVVNLWDYQNCDDGWGVGGNNCLVTQSVDVDAFFGFFDECIQRCDAVSPLNVY
ncbi:IU-nuc-hydro domain-containing protein [Mycena indigotica]|uniref:IU-nuc-hydro domain-containing protein n=1 Tax=Mycena indigotica TaxID=2126181 RepID=A0A8H6SMZ5_9AGAR|nr:IU-nuc-hydro domain-containing protein [Mycena indigotica]KAF7302003.1 IU-nuc-hydro domain-containing protein [Mycena indigotica]